MTGGHGVAARIAALCLDDSGGLSRDTYLAIAVRGGLLVDLALAGRLEQADDGIEVDPTPVAGRRRMPALVDLVPRLGTFALCQGG